MELAALRIGAVMLTVGTGLTLAGVEANSLVLAGAGTVLAGIGFGASALACFGTLARIAAPDERGEVFAFSYVIAYLAFSVPAVLAGFATASLGLRPTALLYGLGVVALRLTALAAQRLRATSRRRAGFARAVGTDQLTHLCDAQAAGCRAGAA